jgi:uncharacterized protein YcbK (DUF882 family)
VDFVMSNLDWSTYPNFTENEFRCKGKDCCGGRADMDPGFMERLQKIRSLHRVPIIITSGFRCAAYDKSIRGAGVHPTGHAADIAVYGSLAHKLVRLALNLGMTGKGEKQHGPHAERFIHLDDLQHGLRPWVWTYS